MISLKNKSKGFTIVELLIVIVIIAILATLVIVTFTGIQAKARDSQRQTDINAVDSHLEAFYAEYGYYPTYKDLTTASFLSTYMKGLDAQALVDPSGNGLQTLSTASTVPSNHGYGYYVSGASDCAPATASDPTGAVATNNGCDTFTLTANLEGSSTPFTKSSNT